MENNQIKNIRDWLRRWGGTCAAGIALLVLILAVGWYWCSIWTFILLDFSENTGNGSRNIALILAAIIGLPLAFWRSLVAAQQANTSERGLQNDRFQKGAEMLGSGVLVVRMGGVVALERLASDQPVEYHIQIMNLLCAFIRHPSEDASHVGASAATNKDDGDDPKCRPDVELAAQVLGRRGEAQRKIERDNEWRADLCDANLRGADLRDAKLENANLDNAKLQKANLIGVNLEGADLTDANLTGVDLLSTRLKGAVLIGVKLGSTFLNGTEQLIGADLTKAKLDNAKLQNANLTDVILEDADLTAAMLDGVQGLTQEEIDTAKASRDNLPNLTNSVCAETGKLLVWGGTTY